MTKPRLTGRSTYFAAGGFLLALGAIIAFVLLPNDHAPAEDDTVVARVNGTDITASDLALAEEEIGTQMPPMPAEGKRDYLVTYVADIVLAAQAAENQKIAEDKSFKQRLAYLRKKLLMQTLLENEAKAALTEDAKQKVYQEATKQFAGEQEVRARHILVPTEEEAKAVAEELKKGADFAELAKQKSKDGSAAQGGDLDYFTKDQMVAEFAEAAFKLDKGQTSDPVQTKFGWHIIKVEDKRDRQAPSFDSVKDQIETYLTRKTQAEYVAKLRLDAKIERLDKTETAPEQKK